MKLMSVDFETYSECNLKEAGLHVYAQHPTTEVMIAVFDGGNYIWKPGQPKPAAVLDYIKAGGQFSAYNAAFERTIWSAVMVPKYGWPEAPLERWHCTAAAAAAMGLPKQLNHCAQFLKLDNQKDDAGHTLMMRLCKPDKKGNRPIPTPEEFQRLIAYCIGDTKTEESLREAIPPLSRHEREVWLLDQRINDRGMYVDTAFAAKAAEFWDEYLETVNARIAMITGGISGSQVSALTNWINLRGVKCVTLSKPVVQDMLVHTPMPNDVREVLELRLEAGTTAVKKFPKFAKCTSPDSRIRGMLRYHGASTGRWAGNLIQPQNFPRGILKPSEIPFVRQLVEDKAFHTIGMLYKSVGEAVGSLCRSVICAEPGNKLLACDYSQVEARGIAWLAGEQSLIEAFAGKEDVYKIMASRIFGIPVEKISDESQERFLGKSAVLGCGYQLGYVGFKRQLKIKYNVDISEQVAKTCVYGYRDANPQICALWGLLEKAVRQSILGIPTRLGPLRFAKTGDWLYVSLPSGRRLAYYQPRIEGDQITVTAPNLSGKPYPEQLYGGKLAENVVSGMCRDLLVFAMENLERSDYPVAGSVHDEVICEVPDDPDWSLEEMRAIVLRLPAWAAGFPLAAGGWESYFYRK